MPEQAMSQAVGLVLVVLGHGPTDEASITEACDKVLEMLKSMNKDVPDKQMLVKEIESRVTVWQPQSVSLDDFTGHQDWLAELSQEISWDFWDRYRTYLETEKQLPPRVIARLDESTTRVLSKLENPLREGPWTRRGLVVGHVQSGKTSHYSALICKAADAGYKFIVVLAGIHNSLRSQTQLRLDEAFLGSDTQSGLRSDAPETRQFGAGAMPGAKKLRAGSLTTSHEAGDFRKAVAIRAQIPIGDIPIVLVVKKQTSILRNLFSWLNEIQAVPVSDGTRDKMVPDIPLLLIDDEADNASINVRDASADVDPTTTNRQIRELLNLFEKSAYVGYTATPFANLFSSPAESEKFGLDIYPRSFIESLRAPSNYLGPVRVFGLASEKKHEEDLVEALPITRVIKDYESWIPDKHKKDWIPGKDIPDSLNEAILSFILVCAARRARGQISVHNSMLVHVTRFQAVQRELGQILSDHLDYLKYRIRYGDGGGVDIWIELENLWTRDFAQTMESWPDQVDMLSWSEVRAEVKPSVEKLSLKVLNGSSQDALDYYENRKHGLNVIAVGGNKLSRGLTLEGLSVSYYLRASRMYDTLMQMGRWFGYRPRYEDLCRLYTTSELIDWYREITVASEELRAEFEYMAQRGATPEDYGLRVRTSASGLSVTSPNKMRSAETLTLSFAEDSASTVTFDVSEASLTKNKKAFEELVQTCERVCGPAEKNPKGFNGFIWRSVSGDEITAFLDKYAADPKARAVRPEFMSRYIKDAMKHGELVEWTVAVFSKEGPSRKVQWAGTQIALTTRAARQDADEIRTKRRMTIGTILSPDHESIDLSDEQVSAAQESIQNDESDSDLAFRKLLRRMRSPQRGLIIIYLLEPLAQGTTYEDEQPVTTPLVGFGISFPPSRKNSSVTYAVTEIWRKLAFEDLDDLDPFENGGDHD